MPQPSTGWPYDAIPGDIAERYRIPIVATTAPRWAYILCVVVGDEIWGGVMPSEPELVLLRSYLDFRLSEYQQSYVRLMSQEPFDLDGGINTTILLKRADEEWCFRMRTWERGPRFIPSYDDPNKLDLAGVLNRRENLTSHWTNWQAEHPLT